MAATKEQTDAALAAAEAKAARDAKNKAAREERRAKLEGETKADAFKRIATRRVNNVLEAMSTLEGVFDTNNYEYTPEQAKIATDALEAGLAKVRARANGEGKTKTGFTM